MTCLLQTQDCKGGRAPAATECVALLLTSCCCHSPFPAAPPAELLAGHFALPKEPSCSLQRVPTGIKRFTSLDKCSSYHEVQSLLLAEWKAWRSPRVVQLRDRLRNSQPGGVLGRVVALSIALLVWFEMLSSLQQVNPLFAFTWNLKHIKNLKQATRLPLVFSDLLFLVNSGIQKELSFDSQK